ncbi:hypothetical protein FJU31_06260 [Stenotrophomonas cyclobalanopsidis]|uniref:Uncharacterized protein n=1 Tax=Stenotrophomonas cyclobalanopsidis TaxID=2771362 RepID=A0ABQ6T340_9GAMM|nr:hypothetical protein [Stenotrophomonas cyclobalanopsidis]KAA9001554.1 hypothetical protein FJU31_06260 [Stenotrophomonas cyclobalanopsidis]
MTLDLDEAREAFEQFLILMDDQIEWLVEQARDQDIVLDGSLQSFDSLESLYASMSATLTQDERAALRVVFARYLGDSVRELYGGQWTLPLDDVRDISFNMPVIVGHSTCPWLEFNPIHTMLAFSLRQESGMIRRVVAHSVDPQILDLSDLAEEE